MAFYKVVGLKTYDPHHANLSKFIGRKCQLMSDTKINADGSRSGQLGFPDIDRMVDDRKDCISENIQNT